MKRHARIITLLVAALLTIVALRTMVLCLVHIPHDGQQPTLLAGDCVSVSRWSYGCRLPLSRLWGYHRWGAGTVQRGHWMAFNSPIVQRGALPDTSGICVGRCMALPGDTVWMGHGEQVSAHRNYRLNHIWPIVVPTAGQPVRVTPWNVRLLALTINRTEPDKASVVGDSLCVSGHFVDSYTFHQDYYWVQSSNTANRNDSRTFGFIPHSALIGRLTTILYSVDPQQPFYRALRIRRTGTML